MKLIYYKSEKGNFGDDLNLWLWPKIFGDTFFDNNDVAFFGIGSILIENSYFLKEAETCKQKVVFGTGVRSINEKFNFDDSWDIRFLRGPYSSLKLTNTLDKYVADGAYFLALIPEYKDYLNIPKQHEIGFIPYFKSIDKVNWQQICDQLGWKLILPTNGDVEQFMKDISSCKTIISEAMHGCILADVLRVPWKRLRFNAHLHEGEKVSEFKWNDWLLSVGIKDNIYIEAPSLRRRKLYKIFKTAFKKKNENYLLDKLKNHQSIDFNLSDNNVMSDLIVSMKEEVFTLKKDYQL
ncbi:polysaccharide pyruvyl transferase family protein [Olleya sp. R77988]|uniref:polysaccharide pyruvyl transferase family protein n=1 Tax=Olleya sp. R77988 TaxID=3093875 RepID=UPI0037C653BA